MADLMDRQPLVLGAVASASAPQWPPRFHQLRSKCISLVKPALTYRREPAKAFRLARRASRSSRVHWVEPTLVCQIKLSDLDRRISLAAHGLRWAARGQADLVTRTRPSAL